VVRHDELDVLVVGDILNDTFIKLFDDKASTSESENGLNLTMPFGMKVPFEHAEVVYGVGNAANAAVALSKLGHKAGLISNAGNDRGGRDLIDALHEHKVDTRFIHLNTGKKTNHHYVLWYKDDRTILINHEHYEYHWPRFRKNDHPKWMYLTSIGANTEDYHAEILGFLHDHPDLKLMFQPGTFHISSGVQSFGEFYKRSDVVVLNREEAVQVTGGNHENMHELIDKMHELGVKVVAISDGPNGAFMSDGNTRFMIPLYPDPAPPLERTGAGDAFASTLLAGLLHGLSLEDAARWAPINSMNVVQHVGAQEGLLKVEDLMNLLRNAPEWYHPKPF
jgi:ribokinase